MIISSLYKYYERLRDDGILAGWGWTNQDVSYGIELDPDGEMVEIYDLREEIVSAVPKKDNGKIKKPKKPKKKPQIRCLPWHVPSRTSGVYPYFLNDNSKYMVGIAGKVPKECPKYYAAAKQKHLDILEKCSGEMAKAIKAYFSKDESSKSIKNTIDIPEGFFENGNCTFLLKGQFADQDPEIQQAWNAYIEASSKDKDGICQITERPDLIVRTHPKIKGVLGAQSAGASLVSFNEPAFNSFGKEQNENASIGEEAAIGYTTALNYLLASKSSKFLLGDTTFVYWSETGEKNYQDFFSAALNGNFDDPDEIIPDLLKKLSEFKSVEFEGIVLDPEKKFYILGLNPNAARLSVRVFSESNLGTIAKNLEKHSRQLKMIKPAFENRNSIALYTLALATANQNIKDKKISPSLPGDLLKAVMLGTPYPETLYTGILSRIRAEQGEVDWVKASAIKAFLLRNRNYSEKELTMALNAESKSIPYTLGRLFCVLERLQNTAAGKGTKLNTTIKDKYFSTAAAAPARVFPTIMVLSMSHLKKLQDRPNYQTYYDKLITDLVSKLPDEFPSVLDHTQQGEFVIGYYHQKQKMFEKHEDKETAE